ncbi:MAG: hypothetical protein B7Z37_16425, partial [Verrucomicrobia bacterium 12-59-8]
MISVIICTHNPRPHSFARVLESLKQQTLAQAQWELLLIDNASAEPINSKFDLSWHSNARGIREESLGLTSARLRGIADSIGDLLVFVDDDNVLALDYLQTAIEIAASFPCIGAFGASIAGEFEVPPPAHLKPYLAGLAVCELTRDYWSNDLVWSWSTPYGAGMVVRRPVGEHYARMVIQDEHRRLLDRLGTGLSSGGDTDLAFCAIDLGFGNGRFQKLKLTHLITKERLTDEYILRLYVGFDQAGRHLEQIRPASPSNPRDLLGGPIDWLVTLAIWIAGA